MTMTNVDPAHLSGQVSLVSSATSITLFGFSLSEAGAVVSACVAVVTCLLHIWYTLRKDRRDRELHTLRMKTD